MTLTRTFLLSFTTAALLLVPLSSDTPAFFDDESSLQLQVTPRETEVLGLLAAGYSDGEIAARLFMSKKTASVHVSAIKGKLGARSRVEIATDAFAAGLAETPGAQRPRSDLRDGET